MIVLKIIDHTWFIKTMTFSVFRFLDFKHLVIFFLETFPLPPVVLILTWHLHRLLLFIVCPWWRHPWSFFLVFIIFTTTSALCGNCETVSLLTWVLYWTFHLICWTYPTRCFTYIYISLLPRETKFSSKETCSCFGVLSVSVIISPLKESLSSHFGRLSLALYVELSPVNSPFVMFCKGNPSLFFVVMPS